MQRAAVRPALLALPLALLAVAAASSGQMLRRAIGPLSHSDRAILDGQRALVNQQALRHAGTPLGGDAERDLHTLQRLVDARVFGPDERHELQSLGVALGDVMVRELGLHWVVLEDERGRSRALRYRETENLIFPVTMISKRYERGVPVDVGDLYEDTRLSVEVWRDGDRLQLRRRFLKPRRPRARSQ